MAMLRHSKTGLHSNKVAMISLTNGVESLLKARAGHTISGLRVTQIAVTTLQAELGEGGDPAKDGVGPLVLGQCMAVSQAGIRQGCQLSESFGE